MASNLSEEEFHRLQEQLIELRTTNYSLDEQCRKLKTENQAVASKLESSDRELMRAYNTISRSKKLKEVEALLAENLGLQRKLQAQEDEFRLQNQTLLQELALLVASNEKLEGQLAAAQDAAAATSPTQQSCCHGDAEKLQAAAAAAEVRTDLEASAEQGLSSLRATLRSLMEPPEPQQSNASLEDGESVELHDVEVSYQKRNSPLVEPLKQAQEKIEALEIDLKEMIGVRLLMESERKEKQAVLAELATLQAGVAELQHKLSSKQASLAQLHNEKEQLYLVSKKQHEELEIAREVEVRALREQLQRLQTQLNNWQAALQDTKDRNATLEAALASAQHQGAMAAEALLEEVRAQLQTAQVALQAATQERASLEQQLRTSTSQASILSTRLEQAELQLLDCTKVADKRKKLLDEMSICMQQKTDELKKQLEESLQEHEKTASELKSQLAKAEHEGARLGCVERELEEALVSVQSLEARRGWLERRQREAEESSATTRAFLENVIQQLKAEHAQHAASLELQLSTEQEKLGAELAAARAASQQQLAELQVLQTQVNDASEERRLLEKKGAVVTRDLRRQLAAERRRSEKLQERVRELSETKGNTSLVADTSHKAAEGAGRDLDTSSISSWSIMSGAMEPRGSSTREGSLVAGSPTNGNENNVVSSTNVDEANLEQENLRLVARLTAMQQQKWVLEERLSHLEEGSAAMVEDLMRKSAVIEHYCMEGGSSSSHSRGSRKSLGDTVLSSPERLSGVLTDKLSSMKKFKDLLKPSNNDEYSPDSHRRMQRMLEETLTKNMHLQKDLENLSKEVERLNNFNTDNNILNKSNLESS